MNPAGPASVPTIPHCCSGGGRDHEAEQDRTSDQQATFASAIRRSISMVDPRDEEAERGDREGADAESNGIEGERSDGIHRLLLGDEPESPDRGGEQHQQIGGERGQTHAGRRYSPGWRGGIMLSILERSYWAIWPGPI